jgi:1-acyl-sn-glycerol-3-phosphate acyltransferase
LYYLLRIFVWLALKIFCRTIRVNRPDLLQAKGPLVLACNHPNAFLDAIILGSLFHQPVHFLARGDTFRKPLSRKLLNALQLIPVYRLSEGKEYLNLNEASFDKCHQILSSGGIVLIFAEGLCLNQWMLRPMKKGTARIAVAAMNDAGKSSEVRILPVSLNYNSFKSLGKTILIHFGEMIAKNDLMPFHSEAEKMHHFNGLLAERLSVGMLQSANHPEIVQTLISNHHQLSVPYLKTIQTKLVSGQDAVFVQKLKMPGSMAISAGSLALNLLQALILLAPAAIGWVLHAPLYLPLKKIIRRKTKETVFFDSVMFGSLVISYPFYWALLNIIIQPLVKNEWISLLFLFMPLLGWISVYWKECFQRVRNYFILTGKERIFLRETLNT